MPEGDPDAAGALEAELETPVAATQPDATRATRNGKAARRTSELSDRWIRVGIGSPG